MYGFSDQGPWVVDADAAVWRRGLHALREQAAAEAPRLLKPRRIPPLRRVVQVTSRVGVALGIWFVVERRGGPRERRAALSRRLRVAFGHLGPTYIKMGQII